MQVKKTSLVILSAVLLAGSVMSSVSKAENSSGSYFGIFREGSPANISLVKKIEKNVGKNFTSIMWYQDWGCTFNPQVCDRVINRGAIPHIVWEPWLWKDKEKIKLDNIIAGEWDSYIKEWAVDIKNWGKPIFLRWGHEFNIEGYPWCVVNNGKDPEKYVKAYRHVVDIFKKEGTTNAKWIWCPMRESWPPEKWNNMEAAYPGDDYVDWIGIDGYNWGTTQSWSQWQTFKELFRDVARQLWRKHPTKPIMIAEFGSSEKGGNKAAWILDIPNDLKKQSYIKALNVFEEKKEADWRLSADPKSLAAFKKILSDPYFASTPQGYFDAVLDTDTTTASTKKVIEAKQASRLPVIDGNLSDWADAEPIMLDQASQLQEGTSLWKGPKDLSGKVYVKWDDKNLYIAGDIVDNTPLINNKKKKNVWNGDAIEIVIGLNKNADPDRSEFVSGDYQIGLSTGNGTTNKPMVWIWQNSTAPTGAQISVTKTSAPFGHRIEASIPWTELGNFTPSAGTSVSFDCALDDANKDERQIQLVWNGDFLFYKDPGVWGQLEFVR